MTIGSMSIMPAALLVPLAGLALAGCNEPASPPSEAVADEPYQTQIPANDSEIAAAPTIAPDADTDADNATPPTPASSPAAAPGKTSRAPAKQAPRPAAEIADPSVVADPHAGHDMSTMSAEDMKNHD